MERETVTPGQCAEMTLREAEKALEEVQSVSARLAAGALSNLPSQSEGRPQKHLPKNAPRKETAVHRKAYLIFQNMGQQRTLRATAKEIGHREDVVGRWAKAFNWWERVRSYDKQLNDAVLAVKMGEVVEARKNTISIVGADTIPTVQIAIRKIKEKFESQELNIEDIPRQAKSLKELMDVLKLGIDILYKAAEWDNGVGRIGNVRGPVEDGSEEKLSGKAPVQVGVFVIEK